MSASILTPPKTDVSVGFINDILGIDWENVLDGGSASGSGTVLFEIFNAFNAVVLLGVVFLVFYTLLAGIVGTAHEGETLGKRYSTLWTPLRGVLAISALMPLPWAKLSLIQAIILKLLFFSIGGADYINSKAIEYMVDHHGYMVAPAPTPQANHLGASMLESVLIQEYFREREDRLSNEFEDFSVDGGRVRGFYFGPPDEIPKEAMGKVLISCEAAGSSDVCEAKLNAAKAMAAELRPLAAALVSLWANGDDLPVDPNVLLEAIKHYGAASQSIMNSALSDGGQLQNELNAYKAKTDEKGWVMIFAWYQKMGYFSERANAMIAVEPSITPPNLTVIQQNAFKELGDVLNRYGIMMMRVTDFLANNTAVAAGADSNPTWSIVGSLLSDALASSLPLGSNTAMTGAATTLAKTIATGDATANLQNLGHNMINAGSIMLSAFEAMKIGSNFVGKLLPESLSPITLIAARLGGSGEFLSKLVEGAAVIIYPIVLTLMLCGVMLAYYLPALPFILGTMAIINWIIVVLEAIVAGTLWMAVHAVPEGEGLVGQRGGHGYMLLLGVLFTPALITMGFFMAVLLNNVAGHFIGNAYLEFVTTSGMNDKPIGPPAQVIAWLATFVVGTALIIAANHKVFSLITWLPNKVLTWIGGPGSNLGGEGDEHRASNMAGVAISRAQGTGQGIAKGIGEFTKAPADKAAAGVETSASGGGSRHAENEMHAQGNIGD